MNMLYVFFVQMTLHLYFDLILSTSSKPLLVLSTISICMMVVAMNFLLMARSSAIMIVFNRRCVGVCSKCVGFFWISCLQTYYFAKLSRLIFTWKYFCFEKSWTLPWFTFLCYQFLVSVTSLPECEYISNSLKIESVCTYALKRLSSDIENAI